MECQLFAFLIAFAFLKFFTYHTDLFTETSSYTIFKVTMHQKHVSNTFLQHARSLHYRYTAILGYLYKKITPTVVHLQFKIVDSTLVLRQKLLAVTIKANFGCNKFNL